MSGLNPTEWEVEYAGRTSVDLPMVEQIIESAGYGMSGWALRARIDEDAQTYQVWWEENEGDPTTRTSKVVTFAGIAQALATVAYDTEFRVNSTLRGYARRAMADNDPGDIDSEVGDVIIQAALFGEIIFG